MDYLKSLFVKVLSSIVVLTGSFFIGKYFGDLLVPHTSRFWGDLSHAIIYLLILNIVSGQFKYKGKNENN